MHGKIPYQASWAVELGKNTEIIDPNTIKNLVININEFLQGKNIHDLNKYKIYIVRDYPGNSQTWVSNEQTAFLNQKFIH